MTIVSPVTNGLEVISEKMVSATSATVPFGQVHVVQVVGRCLAGHARVVHQRVEPAVGLADRRDQRGHRVVVADVGAHREVTSAQALQLGQGFPAASSDRL
jgi:hypothetical protein